MHFLVLNKRWSLTRGVSQRRDHCITVDKRGAFPTLLLLSLILYHFHSCCHLLARLGFLVAGLKEDSESSVLMMHAIVRLI